MNTKVTEKQRLTLGFTTVCSCSTRETSDQQSRRYAANEAAQSISADHPALAGIGELLAEIGERGKA